MSRALKGKRLLIVPEGPEFDPAARFDRLTPLQIVNPEFPGVEDAEMLPEMQREWEKDREERGLAVSLERLSGHPRRSAAGARRLNPDR